MKRCQCYDIKCTEAVVLEAVRGVMMKTDTGQVDSHTLEVPAHKWSWSNASSTPVIIISFLLKFHNDCMCSCVKYPTFNSWKTWKKSIIFHIWKPSHYLQTWKYNRCSKLNSGYIHSFPTVFLPTVSVVVGPTTVSVVVNDNLSSNFSGAPLRVVHHSIWSLVLMWAANRYTV